ncbi:MAG: ATP-binding protein [Mycobacteriales bacterium]
MTTYVARIADGQLAERLRALGAVVIEGPKACGKTATARQHAASEVLLDIDVDAAQAAAIDPRLILDGPVPRLVDEWQREPRVWDAVRRTVDDRGAPGQFILTGSATPADATARHSGAGRISVLRMRPMTLFEQGFSSGGASLANLLDGRGAQATQATLDLRDYTERIVIGGWPQLLDADVPTSMLFARDYLETIIEHDIHTVSGARRDPRLVRRFLHAYAQLTAHPARLSKLVARAGEETEETRDAGPSRWAAEPYLRALRRMMIVDEVGAWDPSLRSSTRLASTPKRHLVDPSLAAALLECSPDRLLRDLNTLGYLFESLATRDVRVYAEVAGASAFHYRERSGDLEVDLIVERTDGAWVGLEVKLGGGLVDRAAASLLRLAASRVATPPAALAVVTAGQYCFRRPDGVWTLPLACLGP